MQLEFFALCALFSTAVAPAETQPMVPDEITVGVESISDASPFRSWYLLNLTLNESTAHAVLIRVAPREFCHGTVVRAIEKDLETSQLEALLNRTDLCSIDPAAVVRQLGKKRKDVGIDDTARSGILASCLGRQILIRLPLPEEVDFARIERRNMKLAALFDFFWDLRRAAFGDTPFFDPDKYPRQLELQQNAVPWVARLKSGRFDAVFKGTGIQGVLAGYSGPVPVGPPIPELLNKNSYHFVQFADPVYPPLAKQARVTGAVKLQLVLDPADGSVIRVATLSGHALLNESATQSAKAWKFDTGYGFTSPLDVTIKYSFGCGPK